MGNLGLVSTQKRGDSFSPLFSLPRFIIEDGIVFCVWFEGGTAKREGFDPATLEKDEGKGLAF
jgi:hypothetical protein